MPEERVENKLAPFERLGMDLVRLPNGNAIGDCPLCGKPGHFFVDSETTQWDCKRCGESGNVISFMTKLALLMAKETHDIDIQRLSALRGIPVAGLKRAFVGYTGEEWWIPVFGSKGTVRDIRRWQREGKLYNTSGDLHLWGLRELSTTPAGTRVWLCEGEWDGIALRWLLDQTSSRADVVVAVPGANVFKRDWVNWFSGRRVTVCYDNDEAGDTGSKKAGEWIKPVAKEVKFLCWPDARPRGWDIRDFVKEGLGKKITAEQGLQILEGLVKEHHRRHQPKASSAKPQAGSVGTASRLASFTDVLEVFAGWVKMDQDFHDALAISLATALSNVIPGDPLWFYLIGPPGSGKSLILMSFQDSERCLFRSTLTPASLVSGFNTHPDPSLLPQMNGKTAVFKDGTELLAMHPEARKEAYGVLRGAFDGSVSKSFGNGIKRDYKLHFNMLVGITPAIHGDSQASMGERFLKFEMRETGEVVDAKIRSAISNIGEEVEMQVDLNKVCASFLSRNIGVRNLPRVPDWVLDRTVALSQLLSVLRAQVEREAYGDRDVRYRPSHEIGTRVGKQLIKLGQVLTYVFEKTEIDHEIYALMLRVAMDTSIGFHLDIVKAMVAIANQGLSRDDLCKRTRIHHTTMQRRLADLEQLRVVQPKKIPHPGTSKTGPVPTKWFLSDEIVGLWEVAHGVPLLEKKSFRTAVRMFEGSEP